MPADRLGPADFADRTRECVAGLPVSVDVFDETDLEEGGFGGILGVGRGSSRPPRLVRVDYSPADAAAHVAVVGKGITFDTGGLSLKPPASMVGMKYGPLLASGRRYARRRGSASPRTCPRARPRDPATS